jgi:phenylacetate-CoA ligase
MTLPRFSREYDRRSRLALELALGSAPVYRPWRRFDPGGAASIDRRYAALPILTKRIMRESFPQGLVPEARDVAEGLARGEIEYVKTSGTTAEQVTNLWNQAWWNASEAASWKLNAHTAHLDETQPEAQLASARSVGFLSEQDLPVEARTLGRFLFLNEKATAREWADRHYERMLRELRGFRPVVLEANPSLLARLSWWALDRGEAAYDPAVILLTYELPSRAHLRSIQRVFSAPICSSFGATEVGYVFMQCEHGKLHQNVAFCRVDFQPLEPVHGGPDVGRILVTTFDNPWASVLRFDIGDLVRLDPTHTCPCGRDEGYILEAVEGRVANVTFTTDGRAVTTRQVDDSMGALDGVRDYQLIQASSAEYHLRLVTHADSHAVEGACREALRALYGRDAAVRTEICEDLEPAVSGKYRRTYAEQELDERSLFA